MEFSQTISWYYTAEAKHGLFNAAVPGVIILTLSLIALCLSAPSSLLKGASLAVALGSLIFILGGVMAGNSARKELPDKIASYQDNPRQFLSQELQRVEKTHKSWFGIRVFWSIFLIVAVAMLFWVAKPFLFGLAVGILIIGTLGHIEEAISYQHNEAYRLAVIQQAR